MMRKLNWIITLVLIMSCTNKKERTIVAMTNNQHISELLKAVDDYYRSEDYEKTIEVINKVLLLDSTIGDAYFKRAYCEVQLNNVVGSIKDYKKASKLGCNLEDCYYNLGSDYVILGSDSLAIVYFTKVLELDPLNVDAKTEIDSLRKR